MIYIERTLEFKRNEAKIRKDGSKTEEPIILYKGDKNIEIQFMIENNPFNYKAGVEITYGQLIVKRQNANPIFSDIVKMSNNKVSFIITEEMIDDLNEVGEYDFQIRLLNADQTSRGTLPPVYAGIVIKEPVCEEDTVGYSAVNYARATVGEVLDIFDGNGDYIKTEWKNGDIITDSKLNKIEEALYEINDNEEYITRTEFDTAINNIFEIMSGANVSYDEPAEALAISDKVEQEVVEEQEQMIVKEEKTYYDSNNENLMI